MQGDTSSNHCYVIIVRLTHHLEKYRRFNSLVACFADLHLLDIVFIGTLATPTSKVSSGE